VGIVEDVPGLLQPLEQPVPGRAPGGREALAPGHRAGHLGQELGAEQLAANRTAEKLVHGGPDRGVGEAAGDGLGERDAGDGGSLVEAVVGTKAKGK
jgi:hypothetical protein